MTTATDQSGGPRLVMLIGPPASGKSFLARLVNERLGATLIQTDLLRKAIFRQPRYTGPEHAVVYGESRRRIARYLRQGRAVVFDGTNLEERQRQLIYGIADDARASLTLVHTYAPPALIQERLALRMSGSDPLDRSDADWDVYLRLSQVEPITRPHLLVNTCIDLTQAVELIVRRAGSSS